MDEKNELHNRNLHISGFLNEEKVDIGDSKVDIENEKVDIQDKKVDIESVLSGKGSNFSVKTTVHIHRLFEKFGFDEVFGRSAVMELLELKGSGASKLFSNLVLNNGLKMPLLGFGTMNIFDEEECTKILKEAYEEGYRLFDCAQIYGNEQIVGSALRKAGIPRDEIFLTTKVWFTNFEGE